MGDRFEDFVYFCFGVLVIIAIIATFPWSILVLFAVECLGARL